MWYEKYEERTSGAVAIALKVLGKGIDVYGPHPRSPAARRGDRTRRGSLEAALPLRPWVFPYSMFLLSASGPALRRTKVALVSVGANAIRKRATRWLFNSRRAARFLPFLPRRSVARAMRQRGSTRPADRVYPDLAFGVPTPPYDPGDPQTVGVGVIAYYGGNDDRRRAGQIHAAYLAKMKRFTRLAGRQWLSGPAVRRGRNLWDKTSCRRLRRDVRGYRPDLDARLGPPSRCPPIGLMQAIAPFGTGGRHALSQRDMSRSKLCKPTISLGYSPEVHPLMADMGMAGLLAVPHIRWTWTS